MVSLIGRFHRHSAAGWAECTVAGPGRVRRHAARFSERSSAPLIGHVRVALSEVVTRLLSTQTNDSQRGGKGHKPLPTPYLPYLIRKVSKRNRKRRKKATVLGACSGLVDRVQASHLHRDRVQKRSNLVHSKSGACAWHALLLGSMR